MIFFRRLAVVSTAFIVLVANVAFAGEIWISVDQARAYKPQSEAVTQVIVGNPFVADAIFDPQTAQLFLVGRTPGTTNVLLSGPNGNIVDDIVVRVRTAPNLVVLHKGAMKQTYSCTNRCDNTATIGDDNDHHTNVSQQMDKRVEASTRIAAD